MSKEEFLKIQTCVLKVNIHCDGCKHKVKKILQKIDGVFTTNIDSEQGKVTISGNVDPAVLIKKLAKSGKHAEIWGAQKPNNQNQNHLANQFKNMQIDNGKGGNNNKGQKGNNQNNNQPQVKGGQQQNQNQQLTQQMQQLLQQQHNMKALQEMNNKMAQFKDMKMPNNHQPHPNQKAVKFAQPEDDEFSDDDLDDFDDDDFDDEDDDFDDEMDDPQHALNKIKPNLGNPNMMMSGTHPQLINAQKAEAAAAGAANGKKGGGAVPVQVNIGGGNGGGKKGGGGSNNGGNQNQGGKNGGGGKPQDGKNGNKNGGGGNGNNMQMGGGKKGNNGGGGGGGAMSDALRSMSGPHGTIGPMGNMPMSMGPMGNMPMGQMGNIPAVQGLPAAAAMNGGGGAGGGPGPNGYFQGAGPDLMPGNPYQQQQHLQQIMNQQRAMGNERFQPMMYARPPPAVNYMPPYPYPYPPPPGPGPDPYTNFFSDENTSSCNVM